MSLGKVKSIIAEAQRHLDFLAGRGSEVASQFIVEKLLRLSAKAEEKGSFIAAVSALKAAGEFTIDPRTQKTEVSHQLRMLSDAELDALYLKEAQAAKAYEKQITEKAGQTVQDAEFTEDNGDRHTPVHEEVDDE